MNFMVSLQGSQACLNSFDYSEKTIIRLDESLANGAKFLDAQVTDTFDICLKWCCEKAPCNLGVWDDIVSNYANAERKYPILAHLARKIPQ